MYVTVCLCVAFQMHIQEGLKVTQQKKKKKIKNPNSAGGEILMKLAYITKPLAEV